MYTKGNTKQPEANNKGGPIQEETKQDKKLVVLGELQKQMPAENTKKIYKHIKDKQTLKELQLGEDTRSWWREFQSGTPLTEKEDLWAEVLKLGQYSGRWWL